MPAIIGKYCRPTRPRGTKMVRAASGPYPVEARASNPNTGTPVQILRLSFPRSEVARCRPNNLSSSDMTFSEIIFLEAAL